jgi:hypothetical protein
MDVTFEMLAVWECPKTFWIYAETIWPTLSAAPFHAGGRIGGALRLVLGAAKRSGTVSRDDMRVLRKKVGRVQADKKLEGMIERLLQ